MKYLSLIIIHAYFFVEIIIYAYEFNKDFFFKDDFDNNYIRLFYEVFFIIKKIK